jgi:hypothetical protein
LLHSIVGRVGGRFIKHQSVPTRGDLYIKHRRRTGSGLIIARVGCKKTEICIHVSSVTVGVFILVNTTSNTRFLFQLVVGGFFIYIVVFRGRVKFIILVSLFLSRWEDWYTVIIISLMDLELMDAITSPICRPA